MTTDVPSAAGVTSGALIFTTKFDPRARRPRPIAMTAAALTAGLALSLATVAVPVWPAKADVPARPAKAVVPGASFGRAVKLSLPLNSASIPNADVFTQSCSSFGNCVAGGTYADRKFRFQALTITEKLGRWGRGVMVRLPGNAPANVQARVSGLACPRAGDCTAVGDYANAANPDLGRVFAATQTGGRWQPATELKLPSGAASPPQAQIYAVSCFAVGSCVATGDYWDGTSNSQAMLITESKGHWHQATEIFPPSGAGSQPDLGFTALSCQGGQCVTAGQYVNAAGKTIGLGLVIANGSYLTVENIKLPRNAAGSFLQMRSVSCQNSSRCVIVGEYGTSGSGVQALSAVESAGAFSAAAEVTAVPPNEVTAVLGAVSCASTGRCVAVGDYADATGHYRSYAVTRSAAGHWSSAAVVPAPADASPDPAQEDTLDGVSCFTAGCVATGFYRTKADATDPMAAVER